MFREYKPLSIQLGYDSPKKLISMHTGWWGKEILDIASIILFPSKQNVLKIRVSYRIANRTDGKYIPFWSETLITPNQAIAIRDYLEEIIYDNTSTRLNLVAGVQDENTVKMFPSFIKENETSHPATTIELIYPSAKEHQNPKTSFKKNDARDLADFISNWLIEIGKEQPEDKYPDEEEVATEALKKAQKDTVTPALPEIQLLRQIA